ncbi:MAG: CPBP family intramembrane metalloprotease [Proteobacteria bacterium]|nr:CPBP family intramembrane metalloprotease [Pseudomonadota bacterium]
MNLALIVNCAIAPVAFLVLCLPALRSTTARKWIPAVVLMSVLDSVATLLPLYVPALQVHGSHWNWSGKIIDIAVMLASALIFIATRRFTARDFGLTFRQAPGTGRAIVFMMIPYLIVMAVLTAKWFGETQPQTAETIWYEATMPGLAEELLWRGILLALLDRMFTGRLQLAGAEIGYGAIAVTLVFALVHGLHFGKDLAMQVSWLGALMAGVTGFLLAWLRLRTKSLVLPVVLHNATNVILETVPLMH